MYKVQAAQYVGDNLTLITVGVREEGGSQVFISQTLMGGMRGVVQLANLTNGSFIPFYCLVALSIAMN